MALTHIQHPIAMTDYSYFNPRQLVLRSWFTITIQFCLTSVVVYVVLIVYTFAFYHFCSRVPREISVANVTGEGGSTKSWRKAARRYRERVSVAMRRSAGRRDCILLHRDSRVSFQRDAMWHFNALFQPAKCLICKTRSRSGRSFAVRVFLPPSSSLSALFECGHLCYSLSLSSLSTSCSFCF